VIVPPDDLVVMLVDGRRVREVGSVKISFFGAIDVFGIVLRTEQWSFVGVSMHLNPCRTDYPDFLEFPLSLDGASNLQG